MCDFYITKMCDLPAAASNSKNSGNIRKLSKKFNKNKIFQNRKKKNLEKCKISISKKNNFSLHQPVNDKLSLRLNILKDHSLKIKLQKKFSKKKIEKKS